MGQSPKSAIYDTRGDGMPFHQGVSDYGRLIPTHRKYTRALSRVANTGDILCSVEHRSVGSTSLIEA